ncbi:MAG: DUF559 domain-containing protein [Actinomycetota bacterium]
MTDACADGHDVRSVEERIGRLAANQFGIISRSQALELGLSLKQIERRVTVRILEPIHPGVYRLAGSTRCWKQDVMAAQTWAGQDSVVSHRTAAVLLGLDGVGEGTPEISVRVRVRTRPGLVMHRTSMLERADWRLRTPFRVTTPERTLFDLASVIDTNSLELALDSALRQRITTLGRIAARLSELASVGRVGFPSLRKMVQARQGREVLNESPLETVWERVARRGRFPPYVCQYVLTENRRYVGRIDFAWPEAKVAVEADSWKHHFGRQAWERDQAKNNFLQEHGWIILRFTWEQLTQRPDEVIRIVWSVLTPRLPLT